MVGSVSSGKKLRPRVTRTVKPGELKSVGKSCDPAAFSDVSVSRTSNEMGKLQNLDVGRLDEFSGKPGQYCQK